MPDLLEYEAKKLFRHFDIATPQGWLWPEAISINGPVVIKVQVPEGGRGKRGGVRPVADPACCDEEIKRMLLEWPGMTPEAVYVEEQVHVERELYLAVVIDRDLRSPVLLCGANGGIDVEESRPVRIPIHPLTGWPPYANRRIQATLKLTGTAAEQVCALARRLVDAFQAVEAELIEINPLGLLKNGDLVALDGKVSIDPSARAALPIGLRERLHADPFLERCKSLYVNGALSDGDIALVVSGAGLLMATLDLITDLGGKPGPLIDLGAALFRGPAFITQTVQMVMEYQPKAILFNYNLQLATCDLVSQAIATAFDGTPPEKWPAVVVRQKGNLADIGGEILRPYGFISTTDLAEASRLVVEAAAGRDA